MCLRFRKMHKKTPVPESLFEQIHRCFPVNFAKFLRTPFLQSTSRRLLLNVTSTFFSILWYFRYFLLTYFVVLYFFPRAKTLSESKGYIINAFVEHTKYDPGNIRKILPLFQEISDNISFVYLYLNKRLQLQFYWKKRSGH